MPYAPFQAGIGTPFIELQTVDSTNNYALARVHAGLAQHGTVFFAHEQVAGKGQRGKTWTADRDSSLILSAVIDPAPLLYTQQFQLSACVALSACELFQSHAGEASCIKWPNDIYWHDRKAGGILIENIIGTGKRMTNDSRADDRTGMTDDARTPPSSVIQHPLTGWQWAIAGIGINLNQASFPAGLKNAVSLLQITGKKFDPTRLARELCGILEKNLRILHTEGFNRIDEAYQRSLYKKDQPVRFRKGARTFEATVKRVSSAGHLVVQHGAEEEFAWGEVEWIIPSSTAAGTGSSSDQNIVP